MAPRGKNRSNPNQAGQRFFASMAFTEERKKIFIEELRRSGRIGHSALKAMVQPGTVADHRKSDPEFDAACERALELYNESIDAEIHRRGHDGYSEMKFEGDRLVEVKTKFSDGLLLAHAKSRLPAYKDKLSVEQRTEHSGALGIAPLGLDKLSPESRQKLREILQEEEAAEQAAQEEASDE